MTSAFCTLYKLRTSLDRDHRQAERRLRLLHAQKQQRSNYIDDIRGIDSFREYFQQRPAQSKKIPRINIYKNHTQLSEWLLERPEDFNNWYLCPCPKGIRCLVVATNGRTEAYYKSGVSMSVFHTNLPGDFRSKQCITILDCVFVSSLSEYYVLDVLAYGTQDLTNCEAAFRFFWIDSRLAEEQLDKVTLKHQYAFKRISKYDCSDENAIRNIFNKYPLWDHSYPELDGYLFYHKESSYIYGKTPLVGWLYPFMVPEVLNLPVNDSYMDEKPEAYTDYLSFIKSYSFNKKEKKKGINEESRAMEIENSDDNTNADDSEQLIEGHPEEEGQHTGEVDEMITAEIDEKLSETSQNNEFASNANES